MAQSRIHVFRPHGLWLLAAAVIFAAGCSGKKPIDAALTNESPVAKAPDRATPEATVGNEIGNRAPDFSLPSADGTTVSLSDYRGKPVVLLFYRGYW